MAAYLCVASNGVPPSISKRVQLRVQCKQKFILSNLTIKMINLYNQYKVKLSR